MDWLAGVLLGLALAMWIDWESPHTKLAIEAREIIEQCEKDLPRSQKCELTARPIESKEDENQSTDNK
jgi:hypothetical protein